MRRFLVIALIIAGSVGMVPAQVKWSKKKINRAYRQAKHSQKLVLVDFYTDWCIWCKRLDKNVWSQKDVGTLVADHFIALKLDAEKGGKREADRVGISGFPTIVVLNFHGEEVGRIVGYRQSADMIAELTKIRKTGKSVGDWRRLLKAKPDSLEYKVGLAESLSHAGGDKAAKGWKEAKKLTTEVLEKDPDNAQGVGARALGCQANLLEATLGEARGNTLKGIMALRLAQPKSDEDVQKKDKSYVGESWGTVKRQMTYFAEGRLNTLSDNLKKMGNPPQMAEPLASLAGTLMGIDPLLGFRAFDMAYQAGAGKDDAGFLNGYAWTLYEKGVALSFARDLAAKSVRLNSTDHMALDTLAHCEFALGNHAKAIQLEKKCLEMAKDEKDARSQKAYEKTLAEFGAPAKDPQKE